MFSYIRTWYNRHFLDPQVILLALLLLFGFVILYLAGKTLTPILAAIVLSFLLDGAVVKLETKWKIPHILSVLAVFFLFIIIVLAIIGWLFPLVIRQLADFFTEVPSMISKGQNLLLQLPAKYPDYISDQDVTSLIAELRTRIGNIGNLVLSTSVSTVPNLLTLLVYLILVPVLIFFFLKDKVKIIDWFGTYLPRERSLVSQVAAEMNSKISSYARGKMIEIMIVWVVTFIVFQIFGLNYAVLLSLIVGLSVIIPYLGAAAVTVPVGLIAYFQWGLSSETLTLMIAYLVIQFLDGNILVPILFSEVVNLHPVAIIMAILIFGSLWGVWGVFFAIPLATLVHAVLKAWPRQLDEASEEL